MALKLRDPGGVPSELWHYLVAQTNFKVYAPNFAALHSMVEKHCVSNNVPVPTLQDVTDWVCNNLGVPCYDDQTRQPLANKWAMGLPTVLPGCCGKKAG